MIVKKRILLVSSAFYPEISPRSFRATELAKEFYRQGHEVIVISKNREHDYSAFLSEYPIYLKMWGKSKFPVVPNFKIRPLSIISRGLSRLLLLLFEYPGIEEMFQVKKLLRSEKGYDLMISFAVPYPVHWGVAWANKKKCPIAESWIADCGDPYMGDRLDSFRKLFYFSYLEKWFCRKADFISIPVESAKKGYFPEFHHKIKIIPQGSDFDIDSPVETMQRNSIPEFAYAGGFLKGIRDPDILMQYLIKIKKPFKFYIFTNQTDLLQKYAALLDNKLLVSEYISRTELMKRLSKMDFLINFDNNTQLNVPSKLIDYSITQRPVLNIDKHFKFDDLVSFIEGDYSNRMKLPDLHQYHIKNISRRFMEHLIQ